MDEGDEDDEGVLEFFSRDITEEDARQNEEQLRAQKDIEKGNQ